MLKPDHESIVATLIVGRTLLYNNSAYSYKVQY